MTQQDIAGKAPARIWMILSTLGLLAIVAGIVMPIITTFMAQRANDLYSLTHTSQAYKYVYASGAVILLVSKLMSPYTGSVRRLRRLMQLEAWSSVFFCVAAFFMFYDSDTTRDWIAFTLAGGAVMAYTSIMQPIVMRKELQKASER